MYQFSIHCLERILKRNITSEMVLWTIENPLQKIVENELTIYQNIFIENEKKYLLSVFVNENKIPPLIITAYKTSKLEKY